MADEPKTFDEKEFLVECKKGMKVRLLAPIHDNVRVIEADQVIKWPYDDPPQRRVAVLATDKAPTPLEAPPMTKGLPEPGQIDPTTGKEYVVDPPSIAG